METNQLINPIVCLIKHGVALKKDIDEGSQSLTHSQCCMVGREHLKKALSKRSRADREEETRKPNNIAVPYVTGTSEKLRRIFNK